MEIYGRRVVVDMPFDTALEELSAALRDEGFTTLALIDVRSHLERTLHADSRRYVLLQVAIPRVLRDALREDVSIGGIVPATIAVFELGDGETAVTVAEPFAALTSQVEWRRSAPHLAELADHTCDHLAAALEALEQDARAYATMRTLTNAIH